MTSPRFRTLKSDPSKFCALLSRLRGFRGFAEIQPANPPTISTFSQEIQRLKKENKGLRDEIVLKGLTWGQALITTSVCAWVCTFLLTIS